MELTSQRTLRREVLKFFYLLFLSLITALLVISDAFSANRVIDNDSHPSVGLMRYKGDISCAVFVVRHGVAVTAKHCFDHYGINEDNFSPQDLSMSFPKKGGNVDFLNTLVEGDDVVKLILDRGENDIAYIIYNRNKTINEFRLDGFKVNDYAEIEEGTEVFRAGFPMGHNTVFDKVITSGCTFTGDSGHFDAMVMDKGYEGLLFDTTVPLGLVILVDPYFQRKPMIKAIRTLLYMAFCLIHLR